MDTEEIKVFTEDGTEIDEETFIEMEPGSTFICAAGNQTWSSQEAQTSTESVTSSASGTMILPSSKNLGSVQRTIIQTSDGSLKAGAVAVEKPQELESDNILEEKSKIYSKQELTKYQKAINDAAFQLSKMNSSLLLNRGKLFEESRKKVKDDGYLFAKGKSRANDGSRDESSVRSKINSDDRLKYIDLLQKDIFGKEEQIRYKTHRVEKAKNMKNWELCDTLTAEIAKLRKETFEHKQEMKLLQRKESQAAWYKKKSKQKSTQKKNEKVIRTKDSKSTSATSPNCSIIFKPSNPILNLFQPLS
ncbi:hypothetical protein AC249_AIPGENE7573 [Exaiptasia diaphana]|nr:hypothetical protein AC249_AIPGENE7573 [Exaiptasia diaphana]